MARNGVRVSAFACAILAAVLVAGCGGGGSAPAAPTGLVVVIGDEGGELTISWTASTGATSYNLYWGNTPGVTTTTGTKIAGAESPHAHTGLTNGTRYYYIVTAVNGDGESSASTEANGLPQINPVGILDTDLDSLGYVQYTADEGWGSGLAIDAEGRIVVSGRVTAGAVTSMALWRYNEDGSPDTTFGGGDGLVTATGTAGGNLDEGLGLAIDGDGRLLVTGYSNNAGSVEQMIIWRFLEDGTPDAGFGAGGVVSYDRGLGGSNWGEAIAVDEGGRILVTGISANATPDHDMALWRYTDAGALDTTFGSGGVVFQSNTGGGNGDDVGYGLALDGSGGIAVAGESANATDSDFVIWRFTDAGALDTSFSGDGIVIYDRGADDRGYGVTFDDEGRVVATGVSDSGTNDDFLVWRYTAAGEPDAAFSGDGVAVYDGGFDDQGWGVLMDSRQRVVAVGMSGQAGGANDMAAVRLTDNGSFDADFDGDGVVTFQIQAGTRNDASSVAFDATGRIVMAGSVEFPVPPPPINMTFWRYE